MRRRRGLTLIEMTIAVGLLAVVGLLWVQVFRGAIGIHHDTTAAHNALSRMEHIAAVLRQDAWRATEIQVVDGDARLMHPDAQVVQWRVEEGTMLLREARGTMQRWPLEQAVALERDGPSLMLRLGAGDDAARMRFVSQIILAQEGQ